TAHVAGLLRAKPSPARRAACRLVSSGSPTQVSAIARSLLSASPSGCSIVRMHWQAPPTAPPLGSREARNDIGCSGVGPCSSDSRYASGSISAGFAWISDAAVGNASKTCFAVANLRSRFTAILLAWPSVYFHEPALKDQHRRPGYLGNGSAFLQQ